VNGKRVDGSDRIQRDGKNGSHGKGEETGSDHVDESKGSGYGQCNEGEFGYDGTTRINLYCEHFYRWIPR
jgi:hypothetical protein